MRYEYGWVAIKDHREGAAPGGVVERQPTKALAEEAARGWVISPLRTGRRMARTVRRAIAPGRPLGWETLDTWQTPVSMDPLNRQDVR